MAAARDHERDEYDVLRQADEIPPLRPPVDGWRRWGRVALGAGIFGVFVISFALLALLSLGGPEGEVNQQGHFMQKSEEIGVQARERLRPKLQIEKNLEHMMPIPRVIQPRPGQADDHFAAHLFDDAVEHLSLSAELTAEEQLAFKTRFIQAMVSSKKTASRDFGGVPTSDYLQQARQALESQKPVMTQALADSINQANLGFRARMRPWMLHESKTLYTSRLGRRPYSQEEVERIKAEEKATPPSSRLVTRDLPDNFDSTTHWPACSGVIGYVENQGHCGSCWAFAATKSLDSRLCIVTNGNFNGTTAELSRTFATACSVGHDGCQGGWEYYVYWWAANNGGLPSSRCMPYFADGEGTEHFQQTMQAPSCPTSCDEQYPRALSDDRFDPQGIINYRRFHMPSLSVLDSEIKAAIYAEGPVTFAFWANTVFMGYVSGIFGLNPDDCGHDPNHAVTAIGWGQEQGVEYILSQNSWGPDWGDHGHMRLALCVPTDWTIAGSMEAGGDYPLPIPTEVVQTTSSSPARAPDPETIACKTDVDGCISSPKWPENYANNEECVISYSFGRINVTHFSTEPSYDTLTVNDMVYSGNQGPHGVLPYTNIVWKSDAETTESGWRICPMAEMQCPKQADGCYTNPGGHVGYGNRQECAIKWTPGQKIHVRSFETEENYDFLSIDGVYYSGTNGPQGVVPSRGNIKWSSDNSVTKSGFKICPHASLST